MRYDARGCGLSDRRDDDITLEACLDDLHAVVDALGPEPVVLLLGLSHAAPAAVQLAALFPQRVSTLVVYGGYARGRLRRGPDAAHLKEAQAILETIEVAFGDEVPYRAPFRRVLNARFFPSASSQEIDAVDVSTIGRFSAKVAAAYTVMLSQADVSEAARQLRCPSLLFHARRDQVV